MISLLKQLLTALETFPAGDCLKKIMVAVCDCIATKCSYFLVSISVASLYLLVIIIECKVYLFFKTTFSQLIVYTAL